MGGTRTLEITIFTVHGSRSTDQCLMINGLTSRNLLSSAWASNLVPDMGTAAETTFEYSSGSADAYGAGFSINLIPKEGGNSFRGSIFATGANKSFQANNYSDDLKAAGLSFPNDLKRMLTSTRRSAGRSSRIDCGFWGRCGGRRTRSSMPASMRMRTPAI